MTFEPEDVIHRFSSSGIVLDTNLLVLLIVGLYDASLIGSFKRTRSFTDSDFDTLTTLLGFFQKIIVTPHVLAEASNLLGHLPEHHRVECFATTFREFIHAVEEASLSSRKASSSGAFVKFGLADAAIAELGSTYAVITDELPLAGYLQGLSLPVINFNHLRDFS